MKHDWQSIPMPPGIAARPKDDRGFPITFVTLIQSDGRPDFTTIDGRRILDCIAEFLCGMCGESMIEDEKVAFIGGPLSIENKNFLDPPMHEWCAAYAMQVCPHIAIDTSRYSKPKLNDGEGRELFPHVDPNRPEKFGLALAKADDLALGDVGGQPVFLIDGEMEVRWQGEQPIERNPPEEDS